MPRNKDGTITRARYTSLKLGELSSVDRPAQPGALAVCLKRDDSADRAAVAAGVAKYICAEDGAHSFAEVLTENKFSEAIWPYTDALSQSIRSIVGDKSLTGADREGRINASVAEFLGAVRTLSPETEKQLAELINKGNASMKTVEQLEAEIATLKGTHTADIAALSQRADKAEKDLAAELEEHGKTKKALTEATDEVITVGGQELRKSEVGEGNFTVAKAMRDERDAAVFEKRAEADFSHLPGTVEQRAGLLKAIDAIADPEAKKAAEEVLTAAEKMAAAGFSRIGTGHGQPLNPTAKAAEDGFMAKVHEIEKRDSIGHTAALSKARREFPEEFANYNGAAN